MPASPSGSISFSFSRHSRHCSNQASAVEIEKPMHPFHNPDTFTLRPDRVHIHNIPWDRVWNSQAAL